MTSLQIESSDLDQIIRPSSRLRVTVGYQSDAPVNRPQFVINIHNPLGNGIYLLHNDFVHGLPDTLPASGKVVCETGPILLTPGRCMMIHLELLKGNVRADLVSGAVYFDVEADDYYGTGMLPFREWVIGVIDQDWRTEPKQMEEK